MSISNSLKDVLSEVKGFLKGKTLDAMIPPLIFVLMNRWLPLPLASFLALAFAILVTSHRLLAKKDWRYALAGLVGVVIAIGFVFISGSAKSYFLPALINTIILFVAALISLIMKKPLAAWLSHLSRGWTLSWFWRFDIRPAYTEVTLLLAR